MNITLAKPYKSINTIPSIKLPSFVILTGLNGAGKSQLLEAINNKSLIVKREGQEIKNIKYVTHTILNPSGSMTSTYEAYIQKKKKISNLYKKYLEKKQIDSSIKIEQVIGKPFIDIIKIIAIHLKKTVEKLDLNDIYANYLIFDSTNNIDVFHQNFAAIFKYYESAFQDNQYKQYLKKEKEEYNDSITDEEFIQKYGEPPWLFVNKILTEANLDYYVNNPQGQEKELPFTLKLINKINKAEIKLGDLSSGEKTIMSLALAFYNSRQDVEFPDLLIMDEPDASLHPLMILQFIKVIQNVFIQDKNVNVIMTTHSPSTIALAPDESLFIMNKLLPRIEKISKDKALSVLLSGVPSLSISYQNRRQVFVESNYDVKYYEKIYDKIKNHLIPEISINFISSGAISKGDGDCNRVKDVVNQLVNFGTKTVFGIIDWDNKNNENEYVKVLGKDQRYSIENYILDPLLLGSFLIREKMLDKKELGFNEQETFIEIKTFSNERLQFIADYICKHIKNKIRNQLDETPKDVKYLGGNNIKLPNWILIIQGHELEDHIKETFPNLKKYQKEYELKQDILIKVVDDVLEILSADFLTIFQEIQKSI